MRRISFGRVGRPPLAFLALGAQLGSGSALAADTKPNGTPIGRTAADRMMTVALFLHSADPKSAGDFVAHVSKLDDPLYHHYLTPSQYEARFGAR